MWSYVCLMICWSINWFEDKWQDWDWNSKHFSVHLLALCLVYNDFKAARDLRWFLASVSNWSVITGSTVWHNVFLFHCLLGVYGVDGHLQAAEVQSGEERLQPCHRLWPTLLLRLHGEMLHSPHRLHLWQHSIGSAKAVGQTWLKALLYWQPNGLAVLKEDLECAQLFCSVVYLIGPESNPKWLLVE